MAIEHNEPLFGTEQELTEDRERESHKIAVEKMDRALDKEYKQYGVRYMNVKELIDAIERGSFEAREIWLENHGYHRKPGATAEWDTGETGLSLLQFIQNRQWWYSDIHTNWDMSHRVRPVMAAFNSAFRGAHRRACQERGDMKDIRKRAMKHFPSLLTAKIEEGQGLQSSDIGRIWNDFAFQRDLEEMIAQKVNGDKDPATNLLQRINENDASKDNLKKIRGDLDAIGDEDMRTLLVALVRKKLDILDVPDQYLPYIQIIKDFYHHPDTFLEDKDNIRKLRDALFFIAGENREYNFTKEGRQYHIAAFFDEAALKTRYGSNWGRLIDTEENFQQKDFLGIVVMFRDRKLIERLTALSKKSGQMAFFVVDRDSTMRYPKRVNLEKLNEGQV